MMNEKCEYVKLKELLCQIKVRLYFALGVYGCIISFMLIPKFQLMYMDLGERYKSALDCLFFSPLAGLFFVSLFMLAYGGSLLYSEKQSKH